MTLTEIALVAGLIMHSLAAMVAVLRVSHWLNQTLARQDERIRNLEHQVNNDVTGRKAVGEMRTDIASIKAQITDIREDIRNIVNTNHRR